MDKKHWAILGIILIATALSCLWVSAYVMDQLPKDHWAQFPTIITSIYFGAFSLIGGIFTFTHKVFA